MKPLIILVAVFLLSLGIYFLISGDAHLYLSGRITMAVMLLFTSLGHFKFTKGMEMMIPAFIPFKKQLVILTGLIEILAAIGLLLPDYYKQTGILLIIFFILILPANISAAIRKVDLEKASSDGSGTGYLWFRLPLQVLFIAWVWWFTIVH